MDNVQNCDTYINILSSQTYRSRLLNDVLSYCKYLYGERDVKFRRKERSAGRFTLKEKKTNKQSPWSESASELYSKENMN
jgi:hypothetical protein